MHAQTLFSANFGDKSPRGLFDALFFIISKSEHGGIFIEFKIKFTAQVAGKWKIYYGEWRTGNIKGIRSWLCCNSFNSYGPSET